MVRAMSECTVCPPWVECVHFEGTILWIGKRGHPELVKVQVGVHVAAAAFVVTQGSAIVACACSPEHPVLDGISLADFPPRGLFHDLDSARTELARRAELLRLEEPARGR